MELAKEKRNLEFEESGVKGQRSENESSEVRLTDP
jgi:hypothetical protein